MNRLKFRIWDKIGKVFRGNLYKYLINAETGELEVWSFSDLYDEWYNTHEDDEHLVVQQCTGLQDRDGKDIYEGDILEYQSSDSEFSTCIVRWTQEYEDNHPGFVITNNYSQYGKPKIIGNIFENPELIEIE